jgi:hypothetical protein
VDLDGFAVVFSSIGADICFKENAVAEDKNIPTTVSESSQM